MKLSFLLTLITTLSVSAIVYSQNGSLNLTLEDQTIRDVLKTIEKQSFYRFFYSDDLNTLDNHVSIDVKEENLETILSAILENTTTSYRIIENNMVIISPLSLLQQGRITGTVTDRNGEPLAGVSVVVKGTTTGTITDINGNFSLILPSDARILTFSFVGMETQEITIGALTQINVTMAESAIGLEEVVVIGYGTVKKKDLTGAVSSVKAEDFIRFKPESTGDFLRSAIPGLKVSYSTSAKSTPDFSIRGENSLNTGGDNPLIVIDDVIFNGDLADINVNDIESVDVLKDASSASIYGSRATNGVIVFTTKKGKQGKATINASMRYSLVTDSRRMRSFNPAGQLKWKEDLMNTTDATYDRTKPYTPYSNPGTLTPVQLTDRRSCIK